jgi:hypothetical protein
MAISAAHQPPANRFILFIQNYLHKSIRENRAPRRGARAELPIKNKYNENEF